MSVRSAFEEKFHLFVLVPQSIELLRPKFTDYKPRIFQNFEYLAHLDLVLAHSQNPLIDLILRCTVVRSKAPVVEPNHRVKIPNNYIPSAYNDVALAR